MSQYQNKCTGVSDYYIIITDFLMHLFKEQLIGYPGGYPTGY